MTARPGVAELLVAIARALKPLGCRWYVFGAQAVIFAGAVRSTADIDITVEDLPAQVLTKALRTAGFEIRTDIDGLADLIEHHRIIPMEHRSSGFQLDVVRAGPGLEEAMLDRATLRTVARVRVPFVSTNDLLVLKTLAGRPKDLEDIRALLQVSDEVDLAVVRARLKEVSLLVDDSTLRALFEVQVKATRRPTRLRRKPAGG